MDKKKIKLGIAPIAWTNDDMPDLGAGACGIYRIGSGQPLPGGSCSPEESARS